jgi:hypothetical protein
MGIFGLGSSVKKKPAAKKPAAKSAAKGKAKAKSAGGNNSEAKAMLAKMQAKSDAGDCPFC